MMRTIEDSARRVGALADTAVAEWWKLAVNGLRVRVYFKPGGEELRVIPADDPTPSGFEIVSPQPLRNDLTREQQRRRLVDDLRRLPVLPQEN